MNEEQRLLLTAATTFEQMRVQKSDLPPKKSPRPRPVCEETLTVPLRWDEHRLVFGCSCRRGHAGDHMCKGFAGRVLKRWHL